MPFREQEAKDFIGRLLACCVRPHQIDSSDNKVTITANKLFLTNGIAKLVEELAKILPTVGELRTLGEIDLLLGRERPYLVKLCNFATTLQDGVLTSFGSSAALDFIACEFSEGGYRLRESVRWASYSKTESLQKAVSSMDGSKLSKALLSHMESPRRNASHLTHEEMAQLYEKAKTMTKDAERYSLTSIAQAISNMKDCFITISPKSFMQPGTAIRYCLDEGELLFVPPIDLESDHDFRARFAAAHELAHILLDHSPKLPGENIEIAKETQAHFVAAVFMGSRGVPTARRRTEVAELSELLRERQDMSPHDCEAIIDFLTQLDAEFVQQKSEARLESSFTTDMIENCVTEFFADEGFRTRAIQQCNRALANLTV